MLNKNYAIHWYNEIRAAAQGDAGAKERIRAEEERRRKEALPPLLDEVEKTLHIL
jgi:hypothetical protein